MRFYTDGSRVGLNDGNVAIGWSVVCKYGAIVEGSKQGGSNINAEMLAIMNLLAYLCNRRVKLIDGEESIEIVTDSLTSIQIINGYRSNPCEYNVNESDNYLAASNIYQSIDKLESRGKSISFIHVRGHGRDPNMSDLDILGNAFSDYVASKSAEILRNSFDKGDKP